MNPIPISFPNRGAAAGYTRCVPPWGLVLAFLALIATLQSPRADTWDIPKDSIDVAANGQFRFRVTLDSPREGKGSTGMLERKSADRWTGVWTNCLVNRTRPVQVWVPDSGRYVVTCDEHGSMGTHPVVIYGADGRNIADLTQDALGLTYDPRLQSVSSYWWNRQAIFAFGPTGPAQGAPWKRTLEDTLFIRLASGQIITIDLASGKIRDAAWWAAFDPGSAQELRRASDEFTAATWERLAREYLRRERFTPDPTDSGITGLLLAGQLQIRDALPLVREIAATERFRHWAAPVWEEGQEGNIQALARAVRAVLE